MSGISKVAVSFAWSEEQNGEHKSAVQNFCDALTQMGIEVVKDSLCLRYGDSLETFMREEVGKSGYLCVFLSEAYLTSHNCMYELLVAYRRAYGNADEFAKRVKIWPLFNIGKYALPADRDRLMKHWTKVATRQRKYAEKNAAKIDHETQRVIRYVCDIETDLNGILTAATTRLCPQSYDEFLELVKCELTPVVSVGPVRPETTFPNVITEINRILRTDDTVADLLCTHLPAVVVDKALTNGALSVLSGSANPLLAGLKSVENQLKSIRSINSDSRRNLLEVLGGLLVLSVDPAWVTQQRSRWDRGGVPLPGRGETSNLGSGRTVSWLELSLAALADSRARLDRVFLNPTATGRRVAAMPVVGQSIGSPADQDAVKLHLIRCVLGDSPEILDDAGRLAMEQLYQEALAVMKVARHDERDPFYTIENDRNSENRKLRSELELPDLLLFSSPSSEPGKFLSNYIELLLVFYRLFDLLK